MGEMGGVVLCARDPRGWSTLYIVVVVVVCEYL